MLERVKRTRRGDFKITLSADERQALALVPEMLEEVVRSTDPGDAAFKRLFPPATMDDEEHNRAFDDMVRDDLAAQRLATIAAFKRTLSSDRLTEDELTTWLAAINDARLVLGVRLAVTEETGPEDFEGDEERGSLYGLYGFMTFLEEHIVRALGGFSQWDLAKELLKEEWRSEREQGRKGPEPPRSGA
ncbi:MAG: DUF2017 family protein [Actinomycetota bacterium]